MAAAARLSNNGYCVAGHPARQGGAETFRGLLFQWALNDAGIDRALKHAQLDLPPFGKRLRIRPCTEMRKNRQVELVSNGRCGDNVAS